MDNNTISKFVRQKNENPVPDGYARYTLMMPCTLEGQQGPLCPSGWESVGFTQPGSCLIGDPPGDGHLDRFQRRGYQRVCKRTVPTTGDLGVDCCSDLFGVSGSVECRAREYNPYSWTCNKIMADQCNSNVKKDPYSYEWNGQPLGQGADVYRPCAQKVISTPNPKQPGCDNREWCVNYLRNAPPNNFFHDHDYTDYSYHFPRYSYTMPAFEEQGTFGYQPMRTPYHPYTEFQSKNASNYCYKNPEECWNTYINSFYY